MNFVTPPNEKIIIIFKRKKNFPTNLKSFFHSLFPIKNQERSRFSNSSKESGGNLLYWNNSLTQRTLKIFPSGSNKNSLRARSLLSSVGQVFIYSLQYGDIQCGINDKRTVGVFSSNPWNSSFLLCQVDRKCGTLTELQSVLSRFYVAYEIREKIERRVR